MELAVGDAEWFERDQSLSNPVNPFDDVWSRAKSPDSVSFTPSF
jgi:hypothetical protein